jgi:hypothetical protein
MTAVLRSKKWEPVRRSNPLATNRELYSALHLASMYSKEETVKVEHMTLFLSWLAYDVNMWSTDSELFLLNSL